MAENSPCESIVARYHGAEAAGRPAIGFRRRVAGRDPEAIPDTSLGPVKLDGEGRVPAPVFLEEVGQEACTSNIRRVIGKGGITIGPDRQAGPDPRTTSAATACLIVRVRKQKIVRVRRVGPGDWAGVSTRVEPDQRQTLDAAVGRG